MARRVHVEHVSVWDNVGTKEKRPGRCVNTVIPGLTPAEEGLGVKPTRSVLASPADHPREHTGGRRQ